MYHLVQKFKKRYSGEVFDENLWQSAYSWSPYMFEKYYQSMAAYKPESMKYLQETHKEVVDLEPVLHIFKGGLYYQ